MQIYCCMFVGQGEEGEICGLLWRQHTTQEGRGKIWRGEGKREISEMPRGGLLLFCRGNNARYYAYNGAYILHNGNFGSLSHANAAAKAATGRDLRLLLEMPSAVLKFAKGGEAGERQRTKMIHFVVAKGTCRQTTSTPWMNRLSNGRSYVLCLTFFFPTQTRDEELERWSWRWEQLLTNSDRLRTAERKRKQYPASSALHTQSHISIPRLYKLHCTRSSE